MVTPTVSVVIPAYKQADFLSEAIESVLSQTYSNWELIVVNDASPDNTPSVVQKYTDPRVRYLCHSENRGLPATRNTGIRASSGSLIALLDADDIFHPEKLEEHVGFFSRHPEVGATYNSRFEMNYSAKSIRELVRPPLTVGLAEMVLGYPFLPSDTVLRRDWAFQVGLFDEKLINGGEDLDFPARLMLTGCRFASVDRALNYRRHHSGRRRHNLVARLDEVLQVLEKIFYDHRCPDLVKSLRNRAHSNNYLVYAEYALSFCEKEMGQSYLKEAVRLNPSLLSGQPCPLTRFLVTSCIADESVDHEAELNKIFSQFPSDLATISTQLDWAITHGFLKRGVRAVIWDRPEKGFSYFIEAKERAADVDLQFLHELVAQLRSYGHEFGYEAANDVVRKLTPFLRQIGGKHAIRQFIGLYSINQAFESYYCGRYIEVPKAMIRAWFSDPKQVTNRGAIAVLLRSMVRRPFGAEV